MSLIAAMRVSMPMSEFTSWVALAFAAGAVAGAVLALKSRRR